MFFNHGCTERISGFDNVKTGFRLRVVGIADNQIRIFCFQRSNFIQVYFRIRRGIFQNAVQQRQRLVVIFPNGLHGALDFIDIGSADRQQNRFAFFGLMLNKRNIGKVRRRNLIDIHHFVEVIRRLKVECR